MLTTTGSFTFKEVFMSSARERPSGGGGGGTDSSECPPKFNTTLVDTAQTGNAAYASQLVEGAVLDLEPTASMTVAVKHQGNLLGYLPPQYSNVAQCIQQGWKYQATVATVTGDEIAPNVAVLVVGTARRKD